MSEDHRLLTCAENIKPGMRLGPISYVVSADQIGRFAAALESRNPLYDPEAPGGTQLAPPTMRLPDYALLLTKHFRGGSGGVHAKHRIEFHHPMRAGQSVRTEGVIAETYRRRGKFYFVLEYESRDADSGELLVRQAITSVLFKEGEMR